MPSREASLRNLEKARANGRPPRPWRSIDETRVIRQLAWQWFNARESRKWSGRAVARWLGVSHTYVQKLVRKFQADPDRMRRSDAVRRPATFENLERAREFTRHDRERGYLREPKPWRLAEFKVGSNVVRAVVPTKAEERRRAAEATGKPLGPTYVDINDLPLWAKELPYYLGHNQCDPPAALRHAIKQTYGPRAMLFHRRWRPRRRFRH